MLLLRKAFFRVCTLLVCCSFSCTSPRHSDKKVFHLNISAGYLESLDPAFAKETSTMWVSHMLYNTLVETDTQLHTVPSLAKSWEVSEDRSHYTFHLRTDVYFHDDAVFPGGKGRRFIAADVVYSFMRLIDPGIASPGAWIFNGRVADTSPFVALNDSTVQINLRAPFAPLPQMLAMQYCNIVPHEAVEHWGRDFRNHPCGTGPFRFSYWDEGNALVLLKNEHYWEHSPGPGTRLPRLDAVQVSFIDSKATEFLLFMQGKIDFVNNIDGSFKDLVLTRRGTLKDEYRSKMNLHVGPYLNTEYLGFLYDSSTTSILVRKAINYSIDRQKIVTYFKNGAGIPAKGFIPAGLPGYDSAALYGYTYDPEKALQLLALAGHPHGKGLRPIHIMIPSHYEDIVNFIAEELREVGITLTIETMQPNVLKQQISNGKAAAFRAQWLADYPDAETYMVCFNGSFPAPPNYTRFNNTTFDEMYTLSLAMPDSPRFRTYTRMDSLVMSSAPVAPLYYERLLHFTQKNISGFGSNAMNIIDLKRVRKQ